jgi:hypothetical protein
MGAVALAGIGASLVLGDDAWRGAIMTAFGTAGEALLTVLYGPILVLGLVAEWLIYLLRLLPLQALQGRAQAQPNETMELLQRLRETSEGPRAIPEWVKAGLLGLAAAVVAVAFLASAKLTQREPSETSGETAERAGVWSWCEALVSARALLSRVLSRLWGRRLITTLAETARGTGGTRPERITDARGAYRTLLRLGRSEHLERRAAQTPAEYLAAWRAELPAELEATELTGRYERARYGVFDSESTGRSDFPSLIERVALALTRRREARTDGERTHREMSRND